MPRRLAPRSRHDGAVLPPFPGGGDDGSGDSGSDSAPNYGDRLRRARLGLAVAMPTVLMLFLSFTAAFVVLRFNLASTGSDRHWIPVKLPWLLLLANTLLLILSSLTIDRARRALAREAALAPVQSIPGVSLGDEPRFSWLALTTGMGLLFLAGQLFAWNRLSAAGFHLRGSTSSSFVYVLTAMHGLHLAGGIVALVIADLWALLRKPVEARRIVVDITSWYWHCMTALWIYILILLWLIA